MDVCLSDFSYFNSWKEDVGGETFKCGTPKYVIDSSTQRKYLNESHWTVRFKCVGLTIATPFVHLVAGVVNIAIRTIKLITFYHFWKPKSGDSYNLKGRVIDAVIDICKIIHTPLEYIWLEFTAIVGILFPYNARKVYASIERDLYDGWYYLAPCFQPSASSHLLGGDINTKDSY